MTVIRILLVVAHIIFTGVWISQFAIDIAFRRVMRGSKDKPVELPLLMAQIRVVSLIGQIGGIGILVTGLGLLAISGYGFLNIGGLTPNWLLFKQVIYLAAMGLVLLVFIPTERKLGPQFVAAAKGTPAVTPEIRALHIRLQMTSNLINLLVLINIMLAVWKPG
jgi:hypothetical protein